MSDETTLLSCPFCEGAAEPPMANKWTNCLGDESFSASMRCHDCNLRIETKSCGYKTEESAIAAIIAAWNTRAYLNPDGLPVGLTLSDDGSLLNWRGENYVKQTVAATLGSDTKPCYAADENYKRCKCSVNRGWRDDAPFLVWDDTGHLFITMGGLKTWDVTDDAKKWFAELEAALRMASQFAADMSGSCPLDMFDYQAGNCEFECRDDYAECWRRYFERGDDSR